MEPLRVCVGGERGGGGGGHGHGRQPPPTPRLLNKTAPLCCCLPRGWDEAADHVPPAWQVSDQPEGRANTLGLCDRTVRGQRGPPCVHTHTTFCTHTHTHTSFCTHTHTQTHKHTHTSFCTHTHTPSGRWLQRRAFGALHGVSGRGGAWLGQGGRGTTQGTKPPKKNKPPPKK